MVDPVITEIPNRDTSRRHTITVSLGWVQKVSKIPMAAVNTPVAVILVTEVNLRPKFFWTWVWKMPDGGKVRAKRVNITNGDMVRPSTLRDIVL